MRVGACAPTVTVMHSGQVDSYKYVYPVLLSHADKKSINDSALRMNRRAEHDD